MFVESQDNSSIQVSRYVCLKRFRTLRNLSADLASIVQLSSGEGGVTSVEW